jgi:hypothetical protein
MELFVVLFENFGPLIWGLKKQFPGRRGNPQLRVTTHYGIPRFAQRINGIEHPENIIPFVGMPKSSEALKISAER